MGCNGTYAVRPFQWTKQRDIPEGLSSALFLNYFLSLNEIFFKLVRWATLNSTYFVQKSKIEKLKHRPFSPAPLHLFRNVLNIEEKSTQKFEKNFFILCAVQFRNEFLI